LKIVKRRVGSAQSRTLGLAEQLCRSRCRLDSRLRRGTATGQPGLYAYLNHNLIEAVLLGATAHFKVEGEWNDDLMRQVKAPAPMP
jgi:hypothetical protein